ncbi:MAG: nickel pincer cofactor biosynthesis protein LarC [Acidobacteria bacterium]|nr:nickel pincer cofactor biosynthesis protein LarC [Acidobacteriota bacterium]
MKLAYLDCFSGISGDMLLGALVVCGAELAAIEQTVARLGIEGIEWSQERVRRGSFMATQVMIKAPVHSHHRHYHHIVEMIRKGELPSRVEQNALEIFRRLGEAEAALHGWPMEKVHFHEVGAVDSIADIVGACAALEMLSIEEIHCSALNVGSGTVECAHGTLPVPAPATAELLKGIPVYSSGIQAEMVTPTGAAIVATLARSFGPLPAMKSTAIGYGAGGRDNKQLPNVLRVTIGEPLVHGVGLERLIMLEANLDDMNPQLCGFFAERAFAAGALDVYFSAVQMKKNRPGVLLSVLCRPEQRDELMGLYFQETTTLGVRCYEVFRRALERQMEEVSTAFGAVRVKVARENGRVLNFSPEFEDCRRLAEAHAVPLRKVLQEAAFVFWNKSRS